MPFHTLSDMLAVRMGATPATWAANNGTYGNWVQLKGKARRALCIVLNGELDGDLLMELFEATDSSGTSAQELSGITAGQSFINGTDEGKVGVFEVLADDLSDGFSHVAVRPTPAATDTFAAVWILGDLYEYPAANAAADGVTFVTGE